MENAFKNLDFAPLPENKSITANLSSLFEKTKKNPSVDLLEMSNHPCMISLIEHPKVDDYVVLNLSRHEKRGKLIKRTDLVVSGMQTRVQCPMAAKYPMHLRKTYYGKVGLSPKEQYEKLKLISSFLSGPKPIDATNNVLRCSYMPGKNLKDLSPFDVRRQEVNIRIAQTTPKQHLMMLWGVLERTNRKIISLHDKGICLGGLDLRYAIYSNHGQHVYLVNVEKSKLRYELDQITWDKACWNDRHEILLLALYIQTAIGQMSGQLAYDSMISINELVGNPEEFLNAVVSKSRSTVH